MMDDTGRRKADKWTFSGPASPTTSFQQLRTTCGTEAPKQHLPREACLDLRNRRPANNVPDALARFMKSEIGIALSTIPGINSSKGTF